MPAAAAPSLGGYEPRGASHPAHPMCLLPDPAVYADAASNDKEADRPAWARRVTCRPAPGAPGGRASSFAEDAWAPGCLTPKTGSPRSVPPFPGSCLAGDALHDPSGDSSLLCSVPPAGRGLLSLHGQHRAPTRGHSQDKHSCSRVLIHRSLVPGTLWGQVGRCLPGRGLQSSGRGRR